MKPFLYRIAELFLKTYGVKISRFAFVFPNKRTGLFFQKYLSEIHGKPLFSPTILTISDLFVELSDKQPADHIQMLFRLYSIYIRRSNSPETFDEFLHWGEMLLSDFDDVDKYMVNARMLFTNITDLRMLESDYTFLSETQIAAIRTFWTSFNPEVSGKKENEKTFLAAWEILYELYTALRQELAESGMGYEGMIYREVVERLKDSGEINLPWDKVVFVGLNALSLTEEKLLTELHKVGLADFYWDYNSAMVTDPENKASYFVSRNLALFPSELPFPGEEELKGEIEVIGIPSGIGQAKQVYSLLEEICQDGTLSGEQAIRTAIVLPDESMLIPVLNSIPEKIRQINVTMGYPLAGTPVASLMEYILALHKNLRYVDRQPMFYFRDVLPVLNHKYIQAADKGTVATLIHRITTFNKIYISKEELAQTPLLSTIFQPVERAEDLSDYLLHVLEQLNFFMRLSHVEEIKEEAEDEEEIPAERLTMRDVEQEFIFHYFITVNRMKEVMKEAGIGIQINTYFKLLNRITENIKIPFKGEPLSGLQIMGILETRALDFDRLIILSMNEGMFPAKKASNSFIPYNLRRGFELPGYEHQDSIWAYHFYRLLQRASKATFIYDTRSTGLLSGEKSRFIHQLHYHYDYPLQDKVVVYNVSSSKATSLQMVKNEKVLNGLARFYNGGERALSASAINTYLDCPLKFYFMVIEDVREEEEVNEAIESDVFGSILHKVLEDIYEPFRGRMVMPDILTNLRKSEGLLTETIQKAFAEIFFKTENSRPLTGRNFLIGEMIRKYTKKVLERDAQCAPFRYLESEKRVKDLFTLSDGRQIQLKGFIDRVDEVNDTIRIIDYKSGEGLSIFKDVESLFNKEEKERSKAVMQVFMYAWIYNRLPEGTNRLVQPGIYFMRRMFYDNFDPNVYYRLDRMKKARVEAFIDFSADFEREMRKCLDEIFNPEIPFIQSPTGKACQYCSFKDICGVK